MHAPAAGKPVAGVLQYIQIQGVHGATLLADGRRGQQRAGMRLEFTHYTEYYATRRSWFSPGWSARALRGHFARGRPGPTVRRRLRGQDKLLARLADGTAVAVRAAAALREATDAVVAMVRPESAALAALLRGQGCHVLESEQASEGMGASLAAAARFLLAGPVPNMPQRADVCLVALADMPWVRRDTLSAVRAAACADGITVPVHQGGAAIRWRSGGRCGASWRRCAATSARGSCCGATASPRSRWMTRAWRRTWIRQGTWRAIALSGAGPGVAGPAQGCP